MFTGIVTDIGSIAAVSGARLRRLEIATGWDTDGIELGASIACSGICLTVVARGAGRFTVELSPETLDRTTAGGWAPGSRINLERALRLGDELGGHFVTGHVDGLATLTERIDEVGTSRLTLAAPEALARYIAAKGSVALDGVSLTVNWIDGAKFGITLIPHTLAHTTLNDWTEGCTINLEVDLLARYLERQWQVDRTTG